MVLAAATGCRFDGDGAGENSRCDDEHRCPGGQVCQRGWCVQPGAVDAGGRDSGADDGLVAWYRMETAATRELVDETGGHHGMCAQGQCPAEVVGRIDGALRFDGVDAWLLFVSPQTQSAALVGFETAGGDVLGSDTAFEWDRWAHVAVTWNGTTKRIYIDGDVVGQAPVEMDFDSRDVLIGADEDLPDVVIPFPGAIDEIRVYGRELLPEQIAALGASF